MSQMIVDNSLLDQVGFTDTERRQIDKLVAKNYNHELYVCFCDDCRYLNPRSFIIKRDIWRAVTGNSHGEGLLCVSCYANRRGRPIEQLHDDFDRGVLLTLMNEHDFGTPYPDFSPIGPASRTDWILQKHLPKLIELGETLWDRVRKDRLHASTPPK
jgi:hypothetical protein